MENVLKRKTNLRDNIIGFCRYLRNQGFFIGPQEEKEAVESITLISSFNQVNFRQVLKAILAKNLNQLNSFENHFYQYWIELSIAGDSKIRKGKELLSQHPDAKFKSLKNWLHGNKPSDDEISTSTFSQMVSKSKQNFNDHSDNDLEEISKVLKAWAKRFAKRNQKRFKKSKKTQQLDFPKTFRYSLRNGFELVDLKFRKRLIEKHKLIVLCDVSKSMDLYSQFLVQFVFAMQNSFKSIETFVFSTHLFRVTNQLKNIPYKEALKELSINVDEWSGGTRIGESLSTFLSEYNYLIDKKTLVMVVSDGWDVGNTELLRKSMKKIKNKSGKTIWLNPLAGNPDFKPEVKGMEAALPFVDILHPCHNLESLKTLTRFF